MKSCNKCNQILPYSDFYPSYIRNGKTTYASSCKKCNKKISVEYGRKNKDKRRKHQIKHLYGLTEKDYNDLLIKYNGACAICKKVPSEKRKLVIDHCHITGKVRGLLCDKCNVAIGLFEDNIKFLEKAKEYLTCA